TNLFAELARRIPFAAKHTQEIALQIEHLDALVARIGDIHLALGVDGNRARSPEDALIGIGSTLGIAQLAPFAEKLAARVEVLNAVIPGVRDIHITVGRHGDAPGLLELAIGGALCAPAGGEAAVLVEHGDPRRPPFDHVEPSIRADGDVLRIDERWSAIAGSAVHD